ncbi:MAG: hypothetical protein ABSC64_02780 [Candidatus Korobacteraceae bacterium]|jgi:hypothetical protein
MPVERREQAIRAEVVKGQRVTPEELDGFRQKAAAFTGLHEPDESSGSCPDL